jgi:type I restriction-modification system DNA methylase subunit
MSGKAQRRRQQEKGQFWTPDWVAEAMVTWLLEDGGGPLFDPAVGNGAFFRAARRVARER